MNKKLLYLRVCCLVEFNFLKNQFIYTIDFIDLSLILFQMSNKMNLIFEPADLEQASPATVSRCGMIYMEPKMLGWKSLMASYSKLLLQKILPEQHELLEELMDWLIPACFDFIQNHCKLFIVTSELHMFYVSILYVLQYIIHCCQLIIFFSILVS